MDTITVEDFDLAATLDSGQVFHWHKLEQSASAFNGSIGREVITIIQTDANTLKVTPGKAEVARHYFALDHDLRKIRRTLPKNDKAMRAALKYAPGLRIMRQPKWECLATFITSSLKQVPHIRQISLKLRERFGEPLESRLELVSNSLKAGLQHSYPTPDALARAGETKLRECGLGYRAKFLHQTAALIADGAFDLEHVAILDDEAACAKLCELPGVGPKIAQCTLLFGFERLGMFPIDVWIERMLRELYFASSTENLSAGILRDFARDHFGPYRGYAQQWLFHYGRVGKALSKK